MTVELIPRPREKNISSNLPITPSQLEGLKDLAWSKASLVKK